MPGEVRFYQHAACHWFSHRRFKYTEAAGASYLCGRRPLLLNEFSLCLGSTDSTSSRPCGSQRSASVVPDWISPILRSGMTAVCLHDNDIATDRRHELCACSRLEHYLGQGAPAAGLSLLGTTKVLCCLTSTTGAHGVSPTATSCGWCRTAPAQWQVPSSSRRRRNLSDPRSLGLSAASANNA